MQLLMLCFKRNVRTVLLIFFLYFIFLILNEIELKDADDRLCNNVNAGEVMIMIFGDVFFFRNKIPNRTL